MCPLNVCSSFPGKQVAVLVWLGPRTGVTLKRAGLLTQCPQLSQAEGASARVANFGFTCSFPDWKALLSSSPFLFLGNTSMQTYVVTTIDCRPDLFSERLDGLGLGPPNGGLHWHHSSSDGHSHLRNTIEAQSRAFEIQLCYTRLSQHQTRAKRRQAAPIPAPISPPNHSLTAYVLRYASSMPTR